MAAKRNRYAFTPRKLKMNRKGWTRHAANSCEICARPAKVKRIKMLKWHLKTSLEEE